MTIKKDVLECVNKDCQYIHYRKCILRLFNCKKRVKKPKQEIKDCPRCGRSKESFADYDEYFGHVLCC